MRHWAEVSRCPLLLRNALIAENKFHYVVLSVIVCDNKRSLKEILLKITQKLKLGCKC